ncbi:MULTISPECIES: MtnX-like HAD-IB family phosphatase [Thermoanaerobacterium]|uniref:2,3-diketo-5-methylthio-1-phosphopentane phosphatase n=1 Tax=Thermoanaerobacterium xylanolyticum (strain ATCC 49914 / DSM 7097 / LX-11) TaxID=858215 RepID=F6BFZ4_THEXL|nr:MtnX-like HAD-IB family phosphatase [Thermoanaerobacterium xylanolyticum]AEF16284.1 2,3-diketo-5-methylthio-1-phosphopentane phosphatase [Thermoanaerobacterium xylanolyticum LX-11]
MDTYVLVDFDGTITKEDTCYAMVKAFAKDGWQEIEKDWEEGKITTEECALETFKIMDMDEEKLKSLLLTMEIDLYFKDFMEFCKDRGYKVIIASDGYDFNIRTVLDKYNIDMEYFSNKLDFRDGKIVASFNTSDDCDKCGSCKLDILKKYKKENTRIIYIGDGYSDICVSKYADLLFAKGVLLKYCEDNGIPSIPFEDFKDIIEYLEKSDKLF